MKCSSGWRLYKPAIECTEIKVIEPGISVQIFIAKNVIDHAVVRVSSGSRRKTFHSAGGTAEVRRNRRSSYFEFLKCLYRRSCLIERRTAVGAGGTCPVQE